MDTKYWEIIFLTFAIVIGAGALVVLGESCFGIAGVVMAFALIIGFGIWLYKYLNKKDKCPLQK